ncbi:MAG: radical SAM protein, partial [Candidatus Methylomirabilis sp.]|nr:radical SAM protein [Deltaproteobacteria bacterium]
MLREDFGEIVDRIKRRGLSVSVNTNGGFIPRWIDRLDRAVRVTLSFDGPPAVHNAVRGEKGYEEVTAAMDLLERRGVTATLTTVLTNRNLDALEDIFAYAARWEAPVLFQPGTLETLGQARPNPTAPETEAYRRAIDRLIAEKRGPRRKVIVNSVRGLYHLRRWPEPTPIPCFVGRLFARVEADGNVYPCGWKREVGDDRPVNVREGGFAAAFRGTALTSCESCWCQTTVELNYALQGDPSTVLNLVGF